MKTPPVSHFWQPTVWLILGLLIMSVGCERPTAQSGAEAGSGAAEEDRHPLVGKPAPAVEGELVDGTPFSLQKATSEHVVLLDFWATWCPPCVIELPVLMKVANEFKDQGVALYAVNVEEDKETIQGFLKDKGWDLQVVMDPQGDFARAYQVTGIPQLAVIGRDGTVRQIHLGFTEELEDELRSELKTLVSSK